MGKKNKCDFFLYNRHSLGAALASLYATDHLNVFNNMSLYTFGSPRVGNSDYFDWFK